MVRAVCRLKEDLRSTGSSFVGKWSGGECLGRMPLTAFACGSGCSKFLKKSLENSWIKWNSAAHMGVMVNENSP